MGLGACASHPLPGRVDVTPQGHTLNSKELMSSLPKNGGQIPHLPEPAHGEREGLLWNVVLQRPEGSLASRNRESIAE